MDQNKFSSRKFILTAFLLIAAIVLLVCKLSDQETWASVTTWVLGLYVTGNVGTYLVTKMATKDRA